MQLPITDAEFEDFRHFVHAQAGLNLHPGKKALVCGRLGKRLQQLDLATYGAYLDWIRSPAGTGERQICIDLLTTNETYFFREPKHFEWLQRHLQTLPPHHHPLHVWSAASSSGEEAYSLAMVLAEHCPAPWHITGSDISQRVLAQARAGHYAMARAQHIPVAYLQRYCLRGTGSQEGTFLIRRELRQQVEFVQVNLNTELPPLGPFDVIFLRNVMIYFNTATKQQVVQRLLQRLRPGGFLCVGHSESLNDLAHPLRPVAPAIFQLPRTVHP